MKSVYRNAVDFPNIFFIKFYLRFFSIKTIETADEEFTKNSIENTQPTKFINITSDTTNIKSNTAILWNKNA